MIMAQDGFTPHSPTPKARYFVHSFNACVNSTLYVRAHRINIMDNIMAMMEKYAYNLEEIVEERTQQLVEEKKKTDRLLYRMLPASVSLTYFLL
jgi:hypothetical protein